MRSLKLLFIAIFALLGTTQCIDETYFGESKEANIIKFSIENETSNKIDPLIDWRDVGTVDIVMPLGTDLTKLKVTTATCSQLAHFKTDPLLITDFSSKVTVYVIAEENNIQKEWTINVTCEKEAPKNEQIPMSKFDTWTKTNNQDVSVSIKDKIGMYPGNGSDKCYWNSTIESNAYLGYFNDFTTLPYEGTDGVKVARIQTIKSPKSIVGTLGMCLATGGFFVGEFIFQPALMTNPTKKEPRKMVNHNCPFHSKPISAKFKMRYKPGNVMMDGHGNEITPENANGRPTADGCDIYIILQDRKTEQGTFIRVASASYRSERGKTIGDFDDDANGYVEMNIPFIYGEPTAEQITEKSYCKIGGEKGEITFFSFTPNGDDTYTISNDPVAEKYATNPKEANVDNITIMFSSSISGDLFYAAPGSTLDIRDFELIYEDTPEA